MQANLSTESEEESFSHSAVEFSSTLADAFMDAQDLETNESSRDNQKNEIVCYVQY